MHSSRPSQIQAYLSDWCLRLCVHSPLNRGLPQFEVEAALARDRDATRKNRDGDSMSTALAFAGSVLETVECLLTAKVSFLQRPIE